MKSAFTLLELLLVIVISTLLIGSVVLTTGTIGRDRARLLKVDRTPDSEIVFQLLQRDIANSISISQSSDARSMTLTGHAGIDPVTRLANDRLTVVTYKVANVGDGTVLYRMQKYVDDPVRPQLFTAVVASDISAIQFSSISADYLPVEQSAVDRASDAVIGDASVGPTVSPMYYVPTHGKILLVRANQTIQKEVWLR